MAELANMPTVSEIAYSCEFEENKRFGRATLFAGCHTSNQNPHFRGHHQAPLGVDDSGMAPSGDSPSLVLQATAGLMGAVARLTQERHAERQKAMELELLTARAKLTTVTSAYATPADPAVGREHRMWIWQCGVHTGVASNVSCGSQASWAIFKTGSIFRSSRPPRWTCGRRWLRIIPADTVQKRGP